MSSTPHGLIAMPGLINAHFHSQVSLMAGSVPSRPLELFMLYEVPPLGDRLPDPRLIYLQTMLGAVEMLRNGVTAVHDDAFHNPWPTRPAIDAVMSAYRDSGLRATVAINHQNRPELDKLPFLAEILPPDIRAEVDAIRIAPLDELTGLYHWFHETWHGAADGRLRIAVSNSAPQRVTEDYFAFLSEFSRTARPAVQHPYPRDQDAARAGHANGSANRWCAWWTISGSSTSACW